MDETPSGDDPTLNDPLDDEPPTGNPSALTVPVKWVALAVLVTAALVGALSLALTGGSDEDAVTTSQSSDDRPEARSTSTTSTSSSTSTTTSTSTSTTTSTSILVTTTTQPPPTVAVTTSAPPTVPPTPPTVAAPAPTQPPTTPARVTTTVPITHEFNGSIVAQATYGKHNYPYCTGQSTFTPPSDVVIRDDETQALIVRPTVYIGDYKPQFADDGTGNYWCTYPFTATLSEGSGYSFQIENEDPIVVQLAEMKQKNWTLSFVYWGE